MKVRPIEEIAEAKFDKSDINNVISEEEALLVAYSAVEEIPSGIPNRRKILWKLREMLLADKK